jgi:hypothetical protein
LSGTQTARRFGNDGHSIGAQTDQISPAAINSGASRLVIANIGPDSADLSQGDILLLSGR